MSAFTNDLKFAREYEMKFISYLDLTEYDEIVMAPNYKFSDYDILVKKGSSETKYEIKADRLASKTGNLCIEFECFEKPSGISITKADYYGYFILGKTEECYIIPVHYLRILIESGDYRKLSGGDEGRSRFYLIPKSKFVQFLTPRKAN